MKHVKPLVLAIAAISLSACSGSKKAVQKLDYQSENNKIISLEVPPDLNDPRNGDLYSLPKGTTASPNALKQPAASGGRKVLAQVKDAHIERRGNQRWLVIKNKSAAEMWPLLRAFWQEAGFTIYSEEPQACLMETEGCAACLTKSAWVGCTPPANAINSLSAWNATRRRAI